MGRDRRRRSTSRAARAYNAAVVQRRRARRQRIPASDAVVVALTEFDRAEAIGARLVSAAHEHVAGTALLEHHERFVLVADA
jgi:hypothetical protein